MYYSVCFLFAFALTFSVCDTTENISVSAQTSQGKTPIIVIDAGHGGEDGGAVSPSGLLEKDINLDIALTLKKFLIQSGFEVKMIRTTDTAIYSSSAVTLREKKTSDLHNRVDIINNNPDNILISIHQNKFEQSKYKGTQIFYSVNNPLSETLANSIRMSVKGLLQNDNNRECKPAEKNIYLLYNSSVPAVLVECGFLSNPEEEELLSLKEYRNNIAFSIYTGFLEFYYQNY